MMTLISYSHDPNPTTMKTAEKIQEEYATSKGYETFEHLLQDDKTAVDWHVSNVQKDYASECVDKKYFTINSVTRPSDSMVFEIGDKVKFSDRFPSFIIEFIIINPKERRVELHGEGLFCSLIESNCTIEVNQS